MSAFISASFASLFTIACLFAAGAPVSAATSSEVASSQAIASATSVGDERSGTIYYLLGSSRLVISYTPLLITSSSSSSASTIEGDEARQMQHRSPVDMLADMLVQVSKMVSLELTNWISFLVTYLGPGTNEFMRNFWFNDFVASISSALAFDVTITQMMLCGDYISKNSKTKRALIGNHQSIHMVSKLMSRQFGFDLMMSKLAQAVTFVITFNSRSNKISHSTI